MVVATVSSKGLVVIPTEVRAALGIAGGDRVEFVRIAERGYEIVPVTYPVTALKGIIPRPARAVSIEAMNEAIARRGGASGQPADLGGSEPNDG